jgi:hypothetical protein
MGTGSAFHGGGGAKKSLTLRGPFAPLPAARRLVRAARGCRGIRSIRNRQGGGVWVSGRSGRVAGMARRADGPGLRPRQGGRRETGLQPGGEQGFDRGKDAGRLEGQVQSILSGLCPRARVFTDPARVVMLADRRRLSGLGVRRDPRRRARQAGPHAPSARSVATGASSSSVPGAAAVLAGARPRVPPAAPAPPLPRRRYPALRSDRPSAPRLAPPTELRRRPPPSVPGVRRTGRSCSGGLEPCCIRGAIVKRSPCRALGAPRSTGPPNLLRPTCTCGARPVAPEPFSADQPSACSRCPNAARQTCRISSSADHQRLSVNLVARGIMNANASISAHPSDRTHHG